MSLQPLQDALDALDEPTWCEGTYAPTERLAIVLPDGDVAAADDPTFVDWLLAHAEPAPFGDGGETMFDADVRDARRLAARGAARVVGFDPTAILGEIEEALSPQDHLEATLVDVLVYPTGGRFARHKDTPYTRELVGTLVVGLPFAHTGGAFAIDDGGGRHRFDWGAPLDRTTLRWVALFSDVDHEIEPVRSGVRVTLVYALSTAQPARRRRDIARADRLSAVGRAIRRLAVGDVPILIACARHAVTGDDAPLDIDALRGTDREIAQLLVASGHTVTVRRCIAASPDEGPDAPRFTPREDVTFARLRGPLPPKTPGALDVLVAFVDEDRITPGGGDGRYPYDTPILSLAPHLLPDIPIERWVIRKKAAATLIHEAMFDEDGYFGNGAFDALLYTLVALEVTRA